MKKKFLSIILIAVMVLNTNSINIFATTDDFTQENFVEMDTLLDSDESAFGDGNENSESEVLTEEENTEKDDNPSFDDEKTDVDEVNIDEEDRTEDDFISDEVGESAVANGTCGNDLTWILDSKGTLTICGTGKMSEWNYDKTAVPWYDYRDSVKKIIIESGVTNIGIMAFYGCAADEVILPDSLVSIDDWAFFSCHNLSEIEIPSSVTSINARAFDNCSYLMAIDVNEKNKNYCSIDGILFSADKTKLLQYPNNYPQDNYTIPDSVQSIEQQAFAGSSTLEHLVIPASVTSFAYSAFSECRKLESAGPIGSDCNIEYGWEKTIPSCAFYSSSIKSVLIGNSITQIDSSAFDWCTSLKDVYYNLNEEQWNKIVIGSNNNYLLNATLHLGDGAIVDPPEPAETMPEPEPLGKPVEITEIGDGTVEHPYRIASVEDFENIAQNPEANYILAADFSISEEKNIDFAGVLDGNHHTIKLYDDGGRGLFASNKGTIKNLNIFVSAEIKIECMSSLCNHETDVGAICARNYGMIQDCTVKGFLNINYYNRGGKLHVGGITGCNEGSDNTDIIKRCWNALHINVNGPEPIEGQRGAQASTIMVGGIAGLYRSSIEKCLNTGDISTNFFEWYEVTRSQYFNLYFGGIVGFKVDCKAPVVACIQAGQSIKMKGWLIGHHIVAPSSQYYMWAGPYYAIQMGFIAGGEYITGTANAFLDWNDIKNCSVWKDSYLKRELNLQSYGANDTFTCKAEESKYKTYNSKVIVKWWKGLKREEKEDTGEEVRTVQENVRYFTEWDAENQTAYFGKNDLLGSKVDEETDTSFLGDVNDLIGKYVLVKTKSRGDELVGPDTLLSIKAVETKTGTVKKVAAETITIDDVAYSIADNILMSETYVGKYVLYHIFEGKIKEIEILKKDEGTLVYWNTKTREVRVNKKYYLSPLADEKTLEILGNTGRKQFPVDYYSDNNGFIYQIFERKLLKNDIDVSKDTWNFKNFSGSEAKYWKFWFPELQAEKLSEYAKEADAGLCYGMVVTDIILNSKEQDSTDFDVNSINKIELQSKSKELGITAEEYIKYMFVLQDAREIKVSNVINDLNGLYKAVKAYQHENGAAVEITIRGQYNGNDSWAHALWGIGVVDEELQSKIIVYDCNHPGKECYITLEKDTEHNENFISWRYDLGFKKSTIFGTGQAGNPQITYVCPDNKSFFEGKSLYEYFKNELKKQEEGKKTNSINSSDVNLVSVSNGKVQDDSLVQINKYGVIEKTGDQEDTVVDTSECYWTEKNNIDVAGNENGVNASLIGVSSSVETDSEHGKSVKLSLEEKNRVILDTGTEDKVDITLKYLGDNEEIYTQEISGISGLEKVNMSSDEKEIIIKGLSSMSITYKEDDKSAEESDSFYVKNMNPEHEYNIVKDIDNEEVSVKEDADNDGIYEKEIVKQSFHKHIYRYRDNGDGTHVKYCIKGDVSFKEEHTYLNGVCCCGAKQDAVVISSGTCGDYLKWTLNSEGIMNIAGTGNMECWKKFAETPWYEEKENVKKVVIGEGVTSVSAEAFRECKNISSIILPDSLLFIGDVAFCQCHDLKDIVFPKNLIYIGSGAFSNCEHLTEVTIPSSVRYIGRYEHGSCPFEYSDRIYGYTNSAAYWRAMKWGITFESLGTLTEEDEDYIGGELIATGKKGENIYWSLYEDGQVFFCGTGSMDDTDPGNGGSAELLSDYSVNVKKVTFTEGIKTIGISTLSGSEYKCFENLSSIEIGDSITDIGERAFFKCPSLQSITIGAGVASIGKYAFSYDTSLKQIIVKNANMSLKSENNVLFSKDGNILYRYPHTKNSEYIIPDTTKIIELDAFGDSDALISITIPNSVEKIMNDAFDGCDNLKNVYFEGSASDWKKIKIEEGNSCLTNAVIHYTKECTGHVWGTWKIFTKATVFEPEQQKRICSVCKKEEVQSVGKKLSPTMKINVNSIVLQLKQSTTKVRITDLKKGDYIKSWKSGNTKIVKVDKKGKITAQKKTGKAMITITLASGLEKQIKVTVQKSSVEAQKITGIPKTVTLRNGKMKTLKPNVLPVTVSSKIGYSSSNKNVATVDSKGRIKAKKKGKATITIKCGKKVVKCRVIVK